MFSESMLSMPAPKVEEPEKTSYLPALLAIGSAWSIALIRGVLGVIRQEGLTLDMALTVLVLSAIPAIVFCIWWAEHLDAPALAMAARGRRRPRLVLVSNH